MKCNCKKNRTRTLVILLTLLATVAIAIIYSPKTEVSKEKQPTEERLTPEVATTIKEGDIAPDFTVEMFDGKMVTLSELKGKVVLINFWATWCPPCREEFKRVESDLIEKFAGQDFLFLPISREESYEVIKAFRDKMGYSFPMGMDPDRAIYNKYAKDYIPRNFLVDKNGVVISSTVGYDEEEFNHLIELIGSSISQ